jgi:hypothetical protein
MLARAGRARSRAMSDRISWNICRGTATSAIWNVTQRPRLTTFASILIGCRRAGQRPRLRHLGDRQGPLEIAEVVVAKVEWHSGELYPHVGFFGDTGNNGNATTLFFSDGIAGETHGLFAAIAPVPEPASLAPLTCALALFGVRRAKSRR